MDQPNLFEDHIYDALEQLVMALGGPKRVGHELWPEKGVDAAAKDLRNALNPDHRARLDLFDLMKLLQAGQRAGDHVAMERLCKDAGYDSPRPVDPEDARAEREKKFIKAVEDLKALAPSVDLRAVR